jgi:hypothetical protein
MPRIYQDVVVYFTYIATEMRASSATKEVAAEGQPHFGVSPRSVLALARFLVQDVGCEVTFKIDYIGFS